MLRVGIIFGGKSVEHEISLRSAHNILDAIDKTQYEPVVIYITKEGKWLLNQLPENIMKSIELDSYDQICTEIAVIGKGKTNNIIGIEKGENLGSIDIVFAILHGTNGEDGSIQGLLQLAGIP